MLVKDRVRKANILLPPPEIIFFLKIKKLVQGYSAWAGLTNLVRYLFGACCKPPYWEIYPQNRFTFTSSGSCRPPFREILVPQLTMGGGGV